MLINKFINGFRNFGLYLLLTTLGLGSSLGLFTGATLLGNNAFVVVPILILFVMFFITAIAFRANQMNIVILTVIFIFAFLISQFTLLISVNEVKIPSTYRYFFNIILALGAFCYLRKYFSPLNIQVIILTVIMSIALVQFLGYVVFPNIQIVFDSPQGPEYIFDGETTRMGLLGSSYVAYHCVLGLLIIWSIKRNIKISFGVYILLLATTLFFLATIILTLNRLALIWALFLLWKILTAYLHLDKPSGIGKIFVSISVILFGLFYGFYKLDDIQLMDTIVRFSEIDGLDDPRIIKLTLGLTMWLNSFTTFLFGVPVQIIETTTINGIIWSDNSFLLISLKFGLIGFLAWALAFSKVIPWGLGSLTLIYLLWTLSSLAITNSILWDSYIFSLIFLLLSEKEMIVFKRESALP